VATSPRRRCKWTPSATQGRSANIANVQDGCQLTVTFPANTQPGQYALSDIGAVATLRINDASCTAAHTDSTTTGTLSISRDDTLFGGGMALQFSLGHVTTFDIAAPMCASLAAAPDDGTCSALAACANPSSASCFVQSGP